MSFEVYSAYCYSVFDSDLKCYTRASVSARSVDFIAAVHRCVASVKTDHGISESLSSLQLHLQSCVFSVACQHMDRDTI